MTDQQPSVTLRFTTLPDPADERRRFRLGHPYLELVYMPLIGATAVALLRRLDLLLTGDTDTTLEVGAAALARELGLRAGRSEPLEDRSPLIKTLGRLSRQGLVTWIDRRHVGSYTSVPILSTADLQRVPEPVRRIHHRYVKDGTPLSE